MGQKKILWVRLDAIGDNILAASTLPYIYEKYEGASITVVCQKHIAELYEASPFVSEVIGVEKMRLFLDAKYRDGVLQSLRGAEFDVAMDTNCSWEQLTDFFVVGSLAKEKIAFENPFGLPDRLAKRRPQVYTTLIRLKGMFEPETEKHRDFLAGIGVQVSQLGATVWTSTADEYFAENFFRENDLDPDRTVALFAFGRSHLRTYPFYGIALSEVCKENGFSVIALGDGAAYGFNHVCLNDIGVRSVNLSGKTTLRQSAALLRRCRIGVGAETGMAHVACAVGTPNVVVIGGGHFGRFMPYSPKTSLAALPLDCYWCDWLCKYEYSHCVVDVAPEVLEFAIRETLRTESERPRLFLQPADRWHERPAGPAWKMPDKIEWYNRVDMIPVHYAKKYDTSTISKDYLESRFAMYKPEELPEIVTSALKTATELRNNGELEKALEMMKKAIDNNPGFPNLLNFKGELEIGLGRLSEARETLFGVITLFPFHTDAMNNIAVVDILQKRYDSAIGVLKRLLEVDPKNKVALSNLGFIENEMRHEPNS